MIYDWILHHNELIYVERGQLCCVYHTAYQNFWFRVNFLKKLGFLTFLKKTLSWTDFWEAFELGGWYLGKWWYIWGASDFWKKNFGQIIFLEIWAFFVKWRFWDLVIWETWHPIWLNTSPQWTDLCRNRSVVLCRSHSIPNFLVLSEFLKKIRLFDVFEKNFVVDWFSRSIWARELIPCEMMGYMRGFRFLEKNYSQMIFGEIWAFFVKLCFSDLVFWAIWDHIYERILHHIELMYVETDQLCCVDYMA